MNVLPQSDASEIVAALYRELLGREPDPGGLSAFGAQLADGAPAGALARIVREINASEEASRGRVNRVLREMVRGVVARRGGGAPAVVGLGTHCYTAALLKAAGLKTESYPFDWVFSTAPMVAHCLADDFATFLDRSYYEPVPPERRRDGPDVNLCDHAFYREQFGIPFVFNHRDPARDDDYAYLVRCVERFRSAALGARATFLLITYPSHVDEGGFDAVSHALGRYAPGSALVHVIVGEPGARGVPASQVVAERGGHTLIKLTPGSRWHPLWFENALDDVSLLTLALERT